AEDRPRPRRPAALDGAGVLPRSPLPQRLHGRFEHPAEVGPELLPAPRGDRRQGPLRKRLAGPRREGARPEPAGVPRPAAAGGDFREDPRREFAEGVRGLTSDSSPIAWSVVAACGGGRGPVRARRYIFSATRYFTTDSPLAGTGTSNSSVRASFFFPSS